MDSDRRLKNRGRPSETSRPDIEHHISRHLVCSHNHWTTSTTISEMDYLPGIVVAIVVQRVSDADLSSVDASGIIVVVCYIDREHSVGLAQVQPPPGAKFLFGGSTGALGPLAGSIPVYGIISTTTLKPG